MGGASAQPCVSTAELNRLTATPTSTTEHSHFTARSGSVLDATGLAGGSLRSCAMTVDLHSHGSTEALLAAIDRGIKPHEAT
jgi:hypothetical protein